MNDKTAFAECREQDGVEVDNPFAIINLFHNLFHADGLVRHGVGEIQQVAFESKRATGRDLLNQEVAGVFLTERINVPLLWRATAANGLDRLARVRTMHAFVRVVFQ